MCKGKEVGVIEGFSTSGGGDVTTRCAQYWGSEVGGVVLSHRPGALAGGGRPLGSLRPPTPRHNPSADVCSPDLQSFTHTPLTQQQ